MSSNRALRMLLAAALAATCGLGLIAAQGCESETSSSSGQEKVLPGSNATAPQGEPGEDIVKEDTAPVEDEKETKPETSDSDAAVSAAKASATASNPSIGALEVLDSKVVGSWARVDLVPEDRSTDGATWLLKKTDGKWTVVDYGTSLIPADHPDAPAELFQ